MVALRQAEAGQCGRVNANESCAGKIHRHEADVHAAVGGGGFDKFDVFQRPGATDGRAENDLAATGAKAAAVEGSADQLGVALIGQAAIDQRVADVEFEGAARLYGVGVGCWPMRVIYTQKCLTKKCYSNRSAYNRPCLVGGVDKPWFHMRKNKNQDIKERIKRSQSDRIFVSTQKETLTKETFKFKSTPREIEKIILYILKAFRHSH